MYKRLYVKKKPNKTPVYQFREKDFTFLKYHRIVSYYIKNKYQISGSELDMILFLYDENVFTKDVFNDFARTMSWDKSRFSQMVKDGLIKKWRDRKETQRSNLWELTIKAKRICNHMYKKLTHQEIISEDPYRNEIFKGKSYMDKIYKDMIKKMNSKTLTRND
jgi:DNA-binding MarR family transcriptional regulator